MTTTGIFTIHHKEVVFDEYNEPYYLLPIGDIHRFAPLCDEERYLEYLEWAKTKKRKLILGMGDYDDLASASERHLLHNRNLHDSSIETLDNFYKSQTDRFIDEWKPFKDDIIGMVEGNHYAELVGGFTTTQYMCNELSCKYLGVSSFIRLSFRPKNRKTRSKVDIWVHHGKGASRKVGGSLNRVEDMAMSADADIYLMGHDHKKSAAFITQMQLNNGGGNLKLSQKKKLLARTGSFLKGYVPGKKSYVADMALNPADLGTIKIELTPRRLQKSAGDTDYIDIHVSI